MSDLGVSGLASGINTDDLVTKLMSIERRPLVTMQSKQQLLQQKSDAWRDLNSRMLTLSNKIADLKNSATFTSKLVTVSDSNLLSASASSSAASGTYSIQVEQLAQSHKVRSNRLESSTASISSQVGGSFQAGKITVGGKTIDVTSTDSLNTLADKINLAKGIVTATLVDNQLVLTSTKTGAANAMMAGNVNGGTVFDGDNDDITQDSNVLTQLGIVNGNSFQNVLAEARDAKLYIDGISVSNSSNTIEGIVKGLSITVKTVSEKIGSTGNTLQDLKAATLNVAVDTQKTADAVKGFVDQYNSVMAFISDKSSYDATTKTKGDLFGDSGLMQIAQTLRNMVGSVVSGVDSKYNSLAMVGISTSGKDATLTLNQSKLSDALQANPSAIATLFGASKTNVALAENGAVIAGASSQDVNYPATSLLDGLTNYDNWNTGGGWQGTNDINSTLSTDHPAYLDIDFGSKKKIDQIVLYTINSNEMPAKDYGVKDFDLQYWDNGWKNIKSISGNTLPVIDTSFDAISTQRIRVNVTAANGSNDAARLVEVNALAQNDGIAARMYDTVQSLVRSNTGVIASHQKAYDSQITDLKNQMDNLSDRLTLREETMRSQFTAMEQAISNYKSQGNSLVSMLNGLPSSNSK